VSASDAIVRHKAQYVGCQSDSHSWVSKQPVLKGKSVDDPNFLPMVLVILFPDPVLGATPRARCNEDKGSFCGTGSERLVGALPVITFGLLCHSGAGAELPDRLSFRHVRGRSL